MRLTVEENREAIKRYRHIERARGGKARVCSTRCPGSVRNCTRTKGHGGPHVAHGLFNRVVAAWDPTTGARGSGQVVRRTFEDRVGSGLRNRKGRPIGLRTRGPAGVLETLRGWVAHALSHVEELALILLFLVFVRFAIEVLISLG
jgi:hypothetical protein